jgi:hypothetical protein
MRNFRNKFVRRGTDIPVQPIKINNIAVTGLPKVPKLAQPFEVGYDAAD